MTCRLRAIASCSLLHCGQIMQSHSYAVEDRLFLGHASSYTNSFPFAFLSLLSVFPSCYWHIRTSG